jgi:PhnB protein
MARRSQIEKLDQAIEAVLTGSTRLASEQGAVDLLIRLASELRNLPRPGFRARLKAELEGKTMATITSTVSAIRKGFHTITPYLQVREAAELIDFITRAFGGQETFRGGPGSEGGMHAEMRIGESMLMIGGGPAWRGTPKPTAIHLYVPNVDDLYKQALEAGATILNPLTQQPYGDREGCVKDPFGNHWYIATNRQTGGPPQGLRTITVSLHSRGADKVITFLKEAFAGDEVFRAASPEGVIHHAQVRVGDSMIEIGEAHGQYQPMPTAIFLYVPDAAATYRGSVQAGATSLWEPAEMYGDLMAGIRDPFGNEWYIATHRENPPVS